jgi:hypothetical protein
MYVHCVHSATSCMRNKIKLTHKKVKTLDILVEFLIECLVWSVFKQCLLGLVLQKTNGTVYKETV